MNNETIFKVSGFPDYLDHYLTWEVLRDNILAWPTNPRNGNFFSVNTKSGVVKDPHGIGSVPVEDYSIDYNDVRTIQEIDIKEQGVDKLEDIVLRYVQ